MKYLVLCSLMAWTILLGGCPREDASSGGKEENAPFVGEPALNITEQQKKDGAGYWGIEVSGPVVNDKFQFTCSEGSRAFYNDTRSMTQVLARDKNNPLTVLMVEFNGNTPGEYMFNQKLGDTVIVVIGVANDDGSMKLAGAINPTADAGLMILKYALGGYTEGSFKGMMSIDKQPHIVRGEFRVRTREQVPQSDNKGSTPAPAPLQR